MFRIISAVLLVAHLPLVAQELDTTRSWVVNGDFERFDTKKLKRMGAIDMAAGWGAATMAKPDLFSDRVAAETKISVPGNFAGDQGALSGGAYAGVRWWSYMAKEPRTYLQTKLKKPMKKDSLYCVRYYVSLGDLSKHATGELGAYLGKMKIAKEDEASLTYEPKVPQVRSTIYTDMSGWQGVCGAFKAEGYEQYLIIGNFAANEKTPEQKVQRPRGSTGAQLMHAYYYIDNVEVYPIKKAGECSCEQLGKGDSEFIFSRKGVMTPGMKPAAIADAQVFYFKRFQSSLDRSMEPWVKELAAAMEQDPAIRIKLIGHIDEKEAERLRMRPDLAALAKQRAESVKAALVQNGIDAARITVLGLDASAPVDELGTEMGMSKNRRVEVELQ